MSARRQGERINNYLLEECVGTGSFGEVWRARHHVFDEVVAIKIPTDAQYVRNLKHEGVAVHGLQHPNIVRAIDLDPYADPPYFIMEYIDGPSLREVIDGQRSGLPIAGAVAILRGILQALSAAHAGGLVHRDVKPANILLRQPPADLSEISEEAVKVTDFGLGHVSDTMTQSILQSGSRLTEEDRSIAGTLAYMSPEQKAGGELDGRSDLFACGVILFEMLTGERPPGGDSPSSLRKDVPPELDDVFRRSYTRWDRRFSSADEMLAALNTRGRGAPPPPPPPILPAGAVRCPACRRDVTQQDQFCIHCGHQLVARVTRCTACEAYVHPADRFCIFCGNDLRVLNQ